MTRSQVLILDPPSQIRFTGPFNDVTTSQLQLSNPTDSRVCFKVKTNVPHQYCVHPSVGIIEPLQHVTVDLMLQPCSSTRPDVDCSHKFMLQTLFAPEGHIASLERLFHQLKPDDMMNTKLSCVFEQPIIRQASARECNGTTATGETQDITQHAAESLKRSTESSPPITAILLLLAVVVAVVYKLLV